MNLFRFSTIALLAAFLAACDPLSASPQEVDLAPLEQRLDAIEASAESLSLQLDALSGQVAEQSEGVRSDIRVLTQEALDLQALIQAPVSLADVEWASLTGLIVQSSPPGIDIFIEPGECGEDVSLPRRTLPADAVLVGTFHPAPTGPHCVSTPETDAHLDSGVTVNVVEGTVSSVSVIPYAKTGN